MKRIILAILTGLLTACGGASLDDVGTTMTGSFSKDTATRASRDSQCYAQNRVGMWASFATAYTWKRVSKELTYEGSQCYSGCIRTRRDGGGIGKFVVGLDPDTTIDFKTKDVIRRWGSGAGMQSGLFYSVFDTGEKRDSRITLRFTPRIKEIPGYYPVVVKYQFVGGEPLVDRARRANITHSDAPEREVVYSHTNPPPAGSTGNIFTEKLYSYLFDEPQPNSLLTIEVSEENGDLIFRGQVDFRDARKVMRDGYAQWADMVKRGCARL